MEIPKPDYYLGIFDGIRGEMTGHMLIEIEKVLIKEEPDMVLVFGDTNSTVAAALASVKLLISVCHIEAGNRLGTFTNPEEINRITTDYISSLLLSCTQSGIEFLIKEGRTDNVHLIGDPMYDAFVYYTRKLEGKQPEALMDFEKKIIPVPEKYYYMTCHRQENTDNDNKLLNILMAMNSLDYKTIYPVHPRNQDRVKRLKKV